MSVITMFFVMLAARLVSDLAMEQYRERRALQAQKAYLDKVQGSVDKLKSMLLQESNYSAKEETSN